MKKHNNIIVLPHRESGEGNLSDISFFLFLNSENITFPICLRGREILRSI